MLMRERRRQEMLITVLQRHKQNRDAIKAAVAKIDPARADQICFGDDWEFTCRAIEQWPTRKGFVVGNMKI
jgi:hypothetical protein